MRSLAGDLPPHHRSRSRPLRYQRPRERIIASHRRWYGWERVCAEKFVDTRERLLDEHLPRPYAEVWIDGHGG